MKKYIASRLLQMLLMLVVISCVNFIILELAPGDLVDVIAGEGAAGDAQLLADLREKYKLDKPLPVRLGAYLFQLAHGDLGVSHRYHRPVLELILDRVSATLLLMVTSLTIAIAAGIVLGTIAGYHANRVLDKIISVVALIGYSTPLFWFGLISIIFFSGRLGWLPSSGMYTIGMDNSNFDHLIDITYHLILPSITLAMLYGSIYIRLVRVSVIDILQLDFIRMARSKGLSSLSIFYRHILPNSILPLLAMVAIQIGAIFGGSVVIEVVFQWPGLGTLAYNALFSRDIMLLMGILFICSLIVLLVNLLIDLLYTWIDPRIKL